MLVHFFDLASEQVKHSQVGIPEQVALTSKWGDCDKINGDLLGNDDLSQASELATFGICHIKVFESPQLGLIASSKGSYIK